MYAEKPMIFVVDTSLFTDGRLKDAFMAASAEEALDSFSRLIEQATIMMGPILYTTPSVQTELRRILLSSGVPLEIVSRIETWLIPKTPDKFSLLIPSVIMWEYVVEIRRRYVRALKIAEEYLKKCYTEKKDLGKMIHELREKFREAVRKGVVDSPEDLDVLLLAFELKGVIVTNDEGLKKLARTLGIITLDSQKFVETLKRLVEGLQKYKQREESSTG